MSPQKVFSAHLQLSCLIPNRKMSGMIAVTFCIVVSHTEREEMAGFPMC